MKYSLLRILPALVAAFSVAGAADVVTFTNYIRQTQMPAGSTWDASDTVAPVGSGPSSLAINPGGARFDLWTVKSSPLSSYLLDTSYVGTYVPLGQVVINSEDNYGRDLTNTGPVPSNLPAMIRRTRADRPFTVFATVSGLRSGADDPAASKSVKFFRHVQSYGTTGTGVNLDRTQATLYSQVSIVTNSMQTLNYTLTSIPGSNRAKVRGEERFSIFSLADYQAPESQLSSQFIQIWPVADAAISGIAQSQLVKTAMPTLTLALNDLYPDSTTYAQVYRGDPALNKSGTVLPGSTQVISDSVPQSRVLSISNYDSAFDGDGHWTMEILTLTPFGIDRLAYLSFDLHRSIEVNGSFTTIE